MGRRTAYARGMSPDVITDERIQEVITSATRVFLSAYGKK